MAIKATPQGDLQRIVDQIAENYSPLQLHLLAQELTATELARRAGIDQSYVSRIVVGKGWPSEDKLAALASVLGLPVSEMASLLVRTREWERVKAAA